MKKILSFLLIVILSVTSVLAYFPLTRVRNFVNDKNNGIPITSSYMDAELNQILTAANLTGIVQGSAPSSPTNGATWFDTSNNQWKVFRNNEWINFSPVYGSSSGYMTTPQKGDLFVNWSSFPNLSEYTGTNWTNPLFINNVGVNWTDLNKNALNATGVNWESIANDASGQYLTSNGNNSVNWTKLATIHSTQTFTSGGSYIVPSPGELLVITVIAGGGGGGSGAPTNAGSNFGGGGGGAGGWAWQYLVYVAGGTYTITVGAAGSGGIAGGAATSGTSSSFGSIISCAGGNLGAVGTNSGGSGTGGTGGACTFQYNSITSCTSASQCTGGQISFGIAGATATGTTGGNETGNNAAGGDGRGTPGGAGGPGGPSAGSSGSNATGFGSSGGGGAPAETSGGPENGGNGAPGEVIVQTP